MDKKVLLYVEDDDGAAFLFEAALREAGINTRIYRASDGEQALAFLRRVGAYAHVPGPDLVLLDLNLPRKSGFEVLAEVQRTESLQGIPIVVFSSSSLMSDRNQSLALGAKRYITKPSTFEGLVESLKSACSLMLQQNHAGAGSPS